MPVRPSSSFVRITFVVFAQVSCYTPQYVYHVVAVMLEKGLHDATRHSGILTPALCAFY
jgi:hypothetical protein